MGRIATGRVSDRLHRALFIFVLWLLTGAAPVAAQLAWDSQQLALRSDSTAPIVTGRFHFVNAGTKPVDIVRVVTSCGCTSATLATRHYEPGQSGDLLITYTRGGYTGLQKKLIEVETNGQPPVTLTLLVDIPEIVRITPAFVTWAHDEAKRPKTLSLKLVVPGKITRLDVQSSDPAVETNIAPVVAGREFRVAVSPRDASHFLRAVLTITCELDGREKKTFTSYATVQPGDTL